MKYHIFLGLLRQEGLDGLGMLLVWERGLMAMSFRWGNIKERTAWKTWT